MVRALARTTRSDAESGRAALARIRSPPKPQSGAGGDDETRSPTGSTPHTAATPSIRSGALDGPRHEELRDAAVVEDDDETSKP